MIEENSNNIEKTGALRIKFIEVRKPVFDKLVERKLAWGKKRYDQVIWDMLRVTPGNKEKMDKIDSAFEFLFDLMKRNKATTEVKK